MGAFCVSMLFFRQCNPSTGVAVKMFLTLIYACRNSPGYSFYSASHPLTENEEQQLLILVLSYCWISMIRRIPRLK